MIKNVINKFFDRILQEYDVKTYNVNLVDRANYKISLADEIANLHSRIRYLEKENVCIANAMYELENRLQSKIDKISPPVLNLNDFSLGD
jgi:SMC interacting uncharacterized protein involved in chromosome segregation